MNIPTLPLSEELYQRAMDASSCGIVIVDELTPDMPLIYVNKAFEEITGYAAYEVLGKNCRFLQGKDRDQPGLTELRAAIREGRECLVVLQNYRKDGTPFWNELHISPIYGNADGATGRAKSQVTHFIGVQTDITHRIEAEKKQTQLVAQLGHVNQELQDFAYIVSHDLKAPLRAIHSLAGWLKSDYAEALGAEGQETIGLLTGRVQRMQGLIDGILHYSRIGRMQEPKEMVALHSLVLNVLDSLDPPSYITINVDEQLPEIEGEPIRLSQLFQNLLSNALKYMDKSEGQIQVGVVERDELWEFFVSDNGPGIEERHFERIFQVFQTLAPRDEIEGTGIGLTLVKKIVESYGGQVWLTSCIGEGSTFYFTLPK